MKGARVLSTTTSQSFHMGGPGLCCAKCNRFSINYKYCSLNKVSSLCKRYCPKMYLYIHNESIVSPVARRYTRVVNGRERLVVCLSEYVPLRILHVHDSSLVVCFSNISAYFV